MKERRSPGASGRADATHPPPGGPHDAGASAIARWHVRFGWWSLLVFLTMGAVLEALHGFKVVAYLSASHSTRRLMWTLAHAHGTALSLVHLGFAFTVQHVPGWAAARRGTASVCLCGASLLLPGGFFLGGFFLHAGDPGLGILLVPVGALLLFLAVFFTAVSAGGMRPGSPPDDSGKRDV